MRKIAISLATMAVLFLANGAQALSSETHAGQAENTRAILNQQPIPNRLDIPVLTHHLQQAPPKKTLGSQPDQEESRLKSLKATHVIDAAECDNYNKTRIPNRDFEDMTNCHHN